MFSYAGLNGDAEIIKEAQRMFAKWAMGDKSAIHPDLRSGVFGIAIQNGGKEEVSPLSTSFLM